MEETDERKGEGMKTITVDGVGYVAKKTMTKKPETLSDWLVNYAEENKNTPVNWAKYGRQIAEATIEAMIPEKCRGTSVNEQQQLSQIAQIMGWNDCVEEIRNNAKQWLREKP